eukprot:SM000393S14713  [mRNA]  locus=s393:44817:45277:- [translate_table: standard]
MAAWPQSLDPVSQAIGLARHLLGASHCPARQSLGLARRPLGATPLLPAAAAAATALLLPAAASPSPQLIAAGPAGSL